VFDANGAYIISVCDVANSVANYQEGVDVCASAGLQIYDGSTSDRYNAIKAYSDSGAGEPVSWYYFGNTDGQCLSLTNQTSSYSGVWGYCDRTQFVFCEWTNVDGKFASK
jgi:hypothetical protein